VGQRFSEDENVRLPRNAHETTREPGKVDRTFAEQVLYSARIEFDGEYGAERVAPSGDTTRSVRLLAK
jgi:hypothetical protein